MSHPTNRRHFLQTTAAAGIGFWVAGGLRPKRANRPTSESPCASIGVGGKGEQRFHRRRRTRRHGGHLRRRRKHAEQRRREAFPKAKRYNDFRKMLDEMGKSIDAVTVSTPDHIHAPAALMAMRMGKHCFCQKPLTHTIYEARLMGETARENEGGHADGQPGHGRRRPAQGGRRDPSRACSGTVKEVHVWTNRPIWPQGSERPSRPSARRTLNWDLWLGPAPERPYANGYHPFAWRGWWDFGTGALGDMACHTVNMPYMALDLRNPIAVQAEIRPQQGQLSEVVDHHFEFPAVQSAGRQDVLVRRRQDRPEASRLYKEEIEAGGISSSGCAVVGDKGRIYVPAITAGEAYLLDNKTPPEVHFVRFARPL